MKNKNAIAMDLITKMAVEQIAREENKNIEDVLISFMESNTGRMVYDDSTKLWCDGFYNFSISPEFNLNDGMRIIKTPTLCPMSNCPFEDNVHKWRIFK